MCFHTLTPAGGIEIKTKTKPQKAIKGNTRRGEFSAVKNKDAFKASSLLGA